MKRGSTILLQVVTALLGVGVLALLLWEPQVEGRNVHATQFEIYFQGSIPGIYLPGLRPIFCRSLPGIQDLRVCRRGEIFLQPSVRALRIIKYCALTTAIFIVGAEAYIFIFVRGTDDVAGGVMMGAFIIFVSAIIATAAAVFERILQNSLDKL
jgi:hypothetical protein